MFDFDLLSVDRQKLYHIFLWSMEIYVLGYNSSTECPIWVKFLIYTSFVNNIYRLD